MAITETGTDHLTAQGRPRWQVRVAGVAVALLWVVLMYELQQNWSLLPLREPHSEGFLIWSAVVAALAAFIGTRYRTLGLWAGGTLACLVVVGLLLGGPDDAFAGGPPSIWGEGGLIRWAAHHVPLV